MWYSSDQVPFFLHTLPFSKSWFHVSKDFSFSRTMQDFLDAEGISWRRILIVQLDNDMSTSSTVFLTLAKWGFFSAIQLINICNPLRSFFFYLLCHGTTRNRPHLVMKLLNCWSICKVLKMENSVSKWFYLAKQLMQYFC